MVKFFRRLTFTLLNISKVFSHMFAILVDAERIEIPIKTIFKRVKR
jgi:hypothetical protein